MHVILEVVVLLLRVIYYNLEALFRLVVPRSRKSVRGKVALVTGAGRGIGRELCIELAKHGARIAALDIDEELCAETARVIENSGGSASHYRCDVTKVKEVSSVISRVRQDLGDVSILVNNAGVLACKSILDLAEAEIRRTLEVNTLAQFWTVKELLPSMISRRDGHVVVISSMAAKDTTHYLTDYCASKFGSNGFSEALTDELRQMKVSGVQLTTVYPLFVNTNLVTDLSDRVEPRSRFDNMLTPQEVATATVDGILRNRRYVYIPSFISLVNSFVLLPVKVRYALKDFIGAGFFTTTSARRR